MKKIKIGVSSLTGEILEDFDKAKACNFCSHFSGYGLHAFGGFCDYIKEDVLGGYTGMYNRMAKDCDGFECKSDLLVEVEEDAIATSREQSKKLLELGLNPETADMWWAGYTVDEEEKWGDKPSFEKGMYQNIPCWTLGALLKLIPNYQLQTQDNHKIGILYGCKEELKIIEGVTPLDAVYCMVVWLLESKHIGNEP